MKCNRCGSDDFLLYACYDDGIFKGLHGYCRKCGHDQIADYSPQFLAWNTTGRTYP